MLSLRSLYIFVIFVIITVSLDFCTKINHHDPVLDELVFSFSAA